MCCTLCCGRNMHIVLVNCFLVYTAQSTETSSVSGSCWASLADVQVRLVGDSLISLLQSKMPESFNYLSPIPCDQHPYPLPLVGPRETILGRSS